MQRDANIYLRMFIQGLLQLAGRHLKMAEIEVQRRSDVRSMEFM
jgi:hypothetical protein